MPLMHKPEEIRQLLSSWGELRAQRANEWQGDALQLPREIADFYEQIGPWGPVIYESVGPVGLHFSAGGNPVLATIDLVIVEFDGAKLMRRYDPESGLMVFSPEL